jgi:hypothetical protein
MIKWDQLKEYPLEKRISVLYEHATFVMAIRYYRHKVNLYLLGNEYLEVFVNHKDASIDRISLLDTQHSRMKFYYDQIKLSIPEK